MVRCHQLLLQAMLLVCTIAHLLQCTAAQRRTGARPGSNLLAFAAPHAGCRNAG